MALRIGIIGAAWGGFAHLPAWRAVPGVEVTAICTSRKATAEAAAERLGIFRAFCDAEAMCADPDIDIVDCGTRPSIRKPMLLAALRHGKHVYNASPHAADWASAKEIDAAWRDSGSVGVVDAFSQWIPAHRQMKAMVAEGYVGTPVGGTCRFNISLFNTPTRQFPYNWFAEAGQGVSAVRNNGSHMLYMLLHLFGPVAELSADDRQILNEWVFEDGGKITPETTDFANVILRFVSGMTMQMQISWSMTLHDGWLIDVFGNKGRIAASSPTFPTMRDCVLHAGQLGGSFAPVEIAESYKHLTGVALGADDEPQPSVAMAFSMHTMVAAIAGNGTASPGFAQALEVERIQEAIRLSNKARSWVTVSDVV